MVAAVPTVMRVGDSGWRRHSFVVVVVGDNQKRLRRLLQGRGDCFALFSAVVWRRNVCVAMVISSVERRYNPGLTAVQVFYRNAW